jgi:hypothetical protein
MNETTETIWNTRLTANETTETIWNTLLTANETAPRIIRTFQDIESPYVGQSTIQRTGIIPPRDFDIVTGDNTRPMLDETQYITTEEPLLNTEINVTGYLRDFDTGSEDYYRGFGKSKMKETRDNIELKKDGVLIGKLFIENNSVKFEGDLDNSAVLLFDMVRKMHSKYINQIYYGLGTYTDSPNRDGLYLADSIISNLDKPFPFTETQKILV